MRLLAGKIARDPKQIHANPYTTTGIDKDMDYLLQVLATRPIFELTAAAKYADENSEWWVESGYECAQPPPYYCYWAEARLFHDFRMGWIVSSDDRASTPSELLGDYAREKMDEIHGTGWRWYNWAIGYAECAGAIYGPWYRLSWVLNDDGIPDRMQVVGNLCKKEMPDSLAHNIQSATRCLMLGNLWLACKNAGGAIQRLPKPDRKAFRARGRKSEPDGSYVYHTLAVPGQVSTHGGMAVAMGTGECAMRRWHLCRGHFKHYSKDRPLFGHWSGTLWVPAHARGSTKAGRVDKTYIEREPT